jgi:hypothetical protein
MKCLYQKIECDWSIPIGDINCSECIHYGKKDLERVKSLYEQFISTPLVKNAKYKILHMRIHEKLLNKKKK